MCDYDPIEAQKAASYLFNQGIMAYADDEKQVLSISIKNENDDTFSLDLAHSEIERFAERYDDELERQNLALCE